MGWGGGADKQLFELKASVEVWSQLFCNILMKGGGGGHCTHSPPQSTFYFNSTGSEALASHGFSTQKR